MNLKVCAVCKTLRPYVKARLVIDVRTRPWHWVKYEMCKECHNNPFLFNKGHKTK